MTKHPISLFNHPFSFLCSALLVLALLGLPEPTEAKACGYAHEWLCPCAEDADATQHGGAKPPNPLKSALLSISIRGSLSSGDVIGSDAPEKFRAYDAAATFKTPWGWYPRSDWGAGVRLMASAGALTGSDDTGLVVSLVPLLALGSRDGRYALDMGAGAALFARTTFGTQDFGGFFQFALTAGIGVPLSKGFGAGYRFMHYSDAGLHGPDTTGADLHMLEISYRFY